MGSKSKNKRCTIVHQKGCIMNDYWDEFISKYGFGDGDHLPPDCWETRTAMVRLINAAAEQLGSDRRVAEYDRPGMHNSCMVLIVPKEPDDETSAEQEADADDALDDAIEMVQYMCRTGQLAGIVRVKVSLDQKMLASGITAVQARVAQYKKEKSA